MSATGAARALLAKFPAVESGLRRAWRELKFARKGGGAPYTVAAGYRLLNPWEWAGVPAQADELFFGYYDKCPWSVSGQRMLLHGKNPREKRSLEIRIFDRAEHCMRVVGTTVAWNWQQGAMSRWLNDADQIVFNAVDRDLLAARVVEASGKELSVIPWPLQTVHPDGKQALTLNYRRLYKYRAEYGYATPVRNFDPDFPLDQDGIWHVNLESGDAKLVVNLAQLLSIAPRPDMNRDRTKINHIIASPSGRRAVFMHRWLTASDKVSRLYAMDFEGNDLRLILDTGLISHYHWRSDEELVLYGNDPEGREGYLLVDARTGDCRRLGCVAMDAYGDGHPTTSPDGSLILSDSYPDARYRQHLLVYQPAAARLTIAASLRHPPAFTGPTRCDLHPRWNRDGQMISIDSAWSGLRGSYILERGETA